ncbi:MAG: glutamine--fructose-6-phosphate aminotransferase, partial [Candidatus Marinimicrobia bacterium]|nr:glutamine--fructose-6-phosphate aminotransferase [Candidatus Neomarinimicrobiota bacterium]
MCGIVGYLGRRPAVEVLLKGLHRLEYRGYDSAGITVLNGGGLQTTKKKGKVKELESALPPPSGETIGLGHTRWATHGEPSDLNAHPHLDSSGRIALVHNGIIENHA